MGGRDVSEGISNLANRLIMQWFEKFLKKRVSRSSIHCCAESNNFQEKTIRDILFCCTRQMTLKDKSKAQKKGRFLIERTDLRNYSLPENFAEMLQIFENNQLSEIDYHPVGSDYSGEWITETY